MAGKDAFLRMVCGTAIGAALAGPSRADEPAQAAGWTPANRVVVEPADSSAGSVVCEDEAAPETPGYLMQCLDGTVTGDWLECRGLTLSGWLEQGFTMNADRPRDRFNFPVGFNDRSNDYQMNQFYLIAERAVDTESYCWDIGVRVDLLYGSDYFFTTAVGLELEQDGTQKWNSDDGPRNASLYGLAMPQAYAELYAPIGNGLTVKAGHFYTILGYEVVPATGNFFYSHAYTMIYGEPFTHTGILSAYKLSDTVKVQAGMTLGSDKFTAPNDNVGFMGGVTWTSCDARTSVAWAMHVADENNPDLDNTRFVQSFVFSHKICENLTYVFQSDFGDEDDASFNFADDVPQDAEWYGINQYLLYEINDCLVAGLRFEWFRDDDHVRVLSGFGSFGEGGDYFGLTAGVNYKPYSNLLIRPEVRWDWSNVSVPAFDISGPYDDLSDKSQFTAAVDVIIRF